MRMGWRCSTSSWLAASGGLQANASRCSGFCAVGSCVGEPTLSYPFLCPHPSPHPFPGPHPPPLSLSRSRPPSLPPCTKACSVRHRTGAASTRPRQCCRCGGPRTAGAVRDRRRAAAAVVRCSLLGRTRHARAHAHTHTRTAGGRTSATAARRAAPRRAASSRPSARTARTGRRGVYARGLVIRNCLLSLMGLVLG
jgi:hypothetical protein